MKPITFIDAEIEPNRGDFIKYANSILTKNAAEAIDIINTSDKFDEKQKMKATRIISKLFSQKSRKHLSEEGAESRIDYLSDHLGIVKKYMLSVLVNEEKVYHLKELNEQAEAKHMFELDL